MSRAAAVAGQFYPGDREELRRVVQGLLSGNLQRQEAIGIVSPHAGYVYSGAIAGATFARIRVPERVVILGPNHHGHGHQAAVYVDGCWETPLGSAQVDGAFAEALLKACPETAADIAAHRFEHSLEVQLPFLQVCNPQVHIVPLCLGHLPLSVLLAIGSGLGRLIAVDPRPTLIVASSDMSHYEPAEVARRKDLRAIDQVLKLDPEGLLQTVRTDRTTMCGVMPTVVLLGAARQLGATRAELVRYGNSGDVTGDMKEVVGYAGVIVM